MQRHSAFITKLTDAGVHSLTNTDPNEIKAVFKLLLWKRVVHKMTNCLLELKTVNYISDTDTVESSAEQILRNNIYPC